MTSKNGFDALALTVDTQTFGKRRADKKNNFAPSVTLEVFK
jgi:isopentenyl diphosphate isomerase/L-lactate dehydrogenase-like FMN-dependent dehydrogenase